jgi:hypothetical protein
MLAQQARRRFASKSMTDPSDVVALQPTHPAARDGRTVYPSTVVSAEASPRLLVSGFNSRKIGSHVTKGAWAGMPIYTLTLEERATCPRSCAHWLDCYGNAMHFARRHDSGPALEARLSTELAHLAAQHPAGFVVRLHVLGDFYSVDYVGRWHAWLRQFKALHVFGYTANSRATAIGANVEALNILFPDRWVVRFSGQPREMGAVTIYHRPNQPRVAEGIVCPAMTGATTCCGACGLCWAETAKKDCIVFIAHGKKRRGVARAA